MEGSFLLFSLSKLDNSRSVEAGEADAGSNGAVHVFLEFCNYSGHMSSYVDYRPCLAGSSQEGTLTVCERFSVSNKLQTYATNVPSF